MKVIGEIKDMIELTVKMLCLVREENKYYCSRVMNNNNIDIAALDINDGDSEYEFLDQVAK